jgi:hypothetical protein
MAMASIVSADVDRSKENASNAGSQVFIRPARTRIRCSLPWPDSIFAVWGCVELFKRN